MAHDPNTTTVSEQKRASKIEQEYEYVKKWWDSNRAQYARAYPGLWVAYGYSNSYKEPLAGVGATFALAIAHIKDYGVFHPLVERLPAGAKKCEDCGYRRVEYPCEICDTESRLKAAVAAVAKARALRIKLKTLKAERKVSGE